MLKAELPVEHQRMLQLGITSVRAEAWRSDLPTCAISPADEGLDQINRQRLMAHLVKHQIDRCAEIGNGVEQCAVEIDGDGFDVVQTRDVVFCNRCGVRLAWDSPFAVVLHDSSPQCRPLVAHRSSDLGVLAGGKMNHHQTVRGITNIAWP